MKSNSSFYREREALPAGGFPISSHIQTSYFPCSMAKMHVHNRIEMLYCLAGKLTVTVNQNTFSFCPGDLVLINSNALHAVDSLGTEENSYFVFQFSPELLYAATPSGAELEYLLPFTLQNAETQKVFSCAELSGSMVPQIIADLQKEYNARTFGYELAIRLEIQQLFLWIMRRWHEQGIPLSWAPGETAQNLTPAFDYVWEHYEQNVTVAQMATLCKMSYSYFSRTFHQLTGQNFVRYLTFVRLLHAKTLLATSTLPVTDIALRVGFSSSSYFIKQFRHIEGIPPYRYRNLLRENSEK